MIDPKVAEHKGRIVKTTGDGILAEFPSVVEAVACAVAVQRGMPERNAGAPEDRIEYRMGIHVGDVIVEDGDIFGDGVNIAARLEGLANPGAILVSARVQEDAVGRLDLQFEDLGERNLKNIDRPVRVYCVRAGFGAAIVQPPIAAPTPEAVGHGVHNVIDVLSLPDRPSIAVLPFTNLSGDAEQEYFADGMADDIITELSRARWLFVIARNSSFTYKNGAVDVKQVARELGVRYVLEGSVRRFKERLRVNAQLIDATTGNHVWAERFDREIVDVFAIQDEITGSVVTAIEPAMAAFERERVARKQPESLDTWELYQRGLWHLYKFGAHDNPIAIELLLKAAASDPSFADPHTALSLAYYFQVWLFAPQDRTWLMQSLEHGRIAAGLDPLDGVAHAAYGLSLLALGEHAAAVKETTHAVALNPNSAMAHGMHITVLAFSGRPREALLHPKHAMRLSP